jgi:hypothetical protein
VATSLYNPSLAAELASMKRRLTALERNPKRGGQADRMSPAQTYPTAYTQADRAAWTDFAVVSAAGLNNPILVMEWRIRSLIVSGMPTTGVPVDARILDSTGKNLLQKRVTYADLKTAPEPFNTAWRWMRYRWVWRWSGRWGWEEGNGSESFSLNVYGNVTTVSSFPYSPHLDAPVIFALSEDAAAAEGYVPGTVTALGV